MHNTQILLKSAPTGELSLSNFETLEAPMPQPEGGQVLVKNLLISQDAANRAWIRGPSYRKAVKVGDVMHAYTIGEVTESDDPNLSIGTRVFGEGGWQNFYVSKPEKLNRVRSDVPLSHLFTLVGIAGKTAYHGLMSVGELKRGDVLVVSAAAGSVGIFAGQIGKAIGCKVIGITGGSQKCEWLVNHLKFDCAVDYKSDSFVSDLGIACGEGVDVFFDNVGGDVCSTVLPLMNLHSRIVCCGAISQYDGGAAASPAGLPGLLVSKRIRMEGFIVFDFADQDEAAEEALLAWAEAGEIKVVEDVINGLENAPKGLIGLLAGENVGKRMILI